MQQMTKLWMTWAMLLAVLQPGSGQDGDALAPAARKFAGSAACLGCHKQQANSWTHSLHARFMRTWAEELQSPVVDWKTVPAAPFDMSKATYLMGNMHKLVFLRATGQDHEFFPQQLDLQTRTWERFDAGLWIPLEDHPNLDAPKSWERLCAGCHVTGFEPGSGKFAEVNIGCENCHGPGSAHVQSKKRNDIINPAALQAERANHICARCHARGRDRQTGLSYPAGFIAGDNLNSTFALDLPAPGTNSPGFWGNGIARMHHSQYNEFMHGKHFRKDVKCFDCHQVHRYRESPPSQETRLMAHTERFLLKNRTKFICVTCHDNRGVNYGTEVAGGKIVDTHTHHPPVIEKGGVIPAAAGKASRQAAPKLMVPMTCQDCHMVKLAVAKSSYDTASHIFHVPEPGETTLYGVPNACNLCHTNQSVAWAESRILEWRKTRLSKPPDKIL
jgi:hypothetical protein